MAEQVDSVKGTLGDVPFQTWTVVCFVILADEAGDLPIGKLERFLDGATQRADRVHGKRDGNTYIASLWFRSARASVMSGSGLFRELSSLESSSKISWYCGIVSGEGSPLVPDTANTLLIRSRAYADAASEGQCIVSRCTFELLRTEDIGLYGLQHLGVLDATDEFATEYLSQLTGPWVNTSIPSPRFANTIINTLPQTSFFVGREQEREEITVLLRTARVVSILGAPGVGKSHLAIRLCRELVDGAFGGVIYIDLSFVSSQSQFIEALAKGFRLKSSENGTVEKRVRSLLRGRTLLVLLDNADRCKGPVAEFVAETKRFSGPKFIITSTKRLNISDEEIVHLSGLSVPRQAPDVDEANFEDYDATSLFLDRVKTVLPHYEPRQDVQDIIALCHALDGNPSGIVLAAKSLKWRSVRETLESVRTASLAAGVGRAQSRLGQAAIGVVENLSKNARAVFLASSILKSPWSVEDASSIADISLSKVASAIPELVDAGLIEVGVLDNRYSVSPSFVTVAPKCATEKEMATLSERHRDHFVSLVCKSVLKFSTSEQGSALASLDHYRLDVATAFGDLLGPSGSSESFANAIVLSWSFWYKCNRLTEGLELIKAALRGIAREEDYQRARLLNVCGILSHKAGDAKTSRNAFKQCIKIAKRLDHKGMLGAACLNLANLEWSEGSPLAAIRLFEEAGEFQRQSNDRIGLGKSLIGSVASYVELGRIEEAIRANQDGRALLQKLEDGTNQWALCIAEGIICSALRQLQPARLAFVRSARLAGEVHDDASLSRSLLWLAQVENLANRAELAAEFLGAMRVRGSESGTHLYPANELRAASVEGAVKATIGETELRRRKFLGGLRSIEELLESCEENKG